jgi:8-oxo-dGTP pyrophosphatase MutT (NUDIX family)
VSIILRPVAASGQDDAAVPSLLFIHRSVQSEDPWSGHMAFPGGRIEETDASPLHAARRETLEEVGIDLERDAELIGQLDDLRATARGRVLPLAISPFVFLLTRPVEARRSEEVAEVLWVPVPMLLDPANASTVPYVLEGQRFELPGIKVFDRTIWGLTYQMLMRLFRLLEW